MKTYRIFLAAGLAALSSATSAKVVFCAATGRAVPTMRYYTPFVDIGSSETASIELGRAFEAHLRTTHPEGDSWDAHCDTESSLSSSESRLSWFKYNNQNQQWIPTDFTGGFPKATDLTQDSDTSGPHLTVKKVGPTPAEVAAEKTRLELEGQRAGAAANAKRIADAARNEATTKAQLDKFLAELKKRGSAQ